MSYALLDLLDPLDPLDYGMSQSALYQNPIGILFRFLAFLRLYERSRDIIIVHPHSTILGLSLIHI